MPPRRLLALVVAGCLALTAPAAAAPPDHPRRAVLDVATYNVYLGADLSPLFTATTRAELVARAGAVYAAVERTDFPERAEAIAELLAREKPDVVGLQEVALWETAAGSLERPGAFRPSYDFLQVLLAELAERGAPYRAVASNTNFTGTMPIALPGPTSPSTRWARFTDADVVLARADVRSRHLTVDQASVEEENFAAVLTIPSPVPGVAPFRVPRGWSSVDVTVKGFTFRLFNTHLEAFGGESVRNRQAAQLAGAVQRSPHPAVVVGDINSRPPGCSTNTAAFQTLLDAGLREVWPAVHRRDPCGGFTSGQSPDLRDERSRLDHRIDVVLFDPAALSALQTEVIGEEQRDRTEPSGMWPSDHAGAVATLKTRRP